MLINANDIQLMMSLIITDAKRNDEQPIIYAKGDYVLRVVPDEQYETLYLDFIDESTGLLLRSVEVTESSNLGELFGNMVSDINDRVIYQQMISKKVSELLGPNPTSKGNFMVQDLIRELEKYL